MKCFYHVDSDGFCSGFWVKKFCDNHNVEYNSNDFRMINYGWNFPFQDIKKDELVWIVDFSIPPEDMTKLLSITKNVIWIDHHVTAINNYKNFPHKIAGVRCSRPISGCMLTFLYTHHIWSLRYPGGHAEHPSVYSGLSKYPICEPELFDMLVAKYNLCNEKLAPLFTRLINDHDVWLHKYGNTTRYFQTALMSKNEASHPCNEFWEKLYSNPNETQYLIDNGKIMYEYKTASEAQYVKRYSFDYTWEVNGKKYKCCVMNIGAVNVSAFDAVPNHDDYDIFIAFTYNGRRQLYQYSLYSDSIDVSKIAKSLGGGGHKGASAFTHSENIFI